MCNPFGCLEGDKAMDLLKELQEVKNAIKQALADGKVSLLEAAVIAREIVDVLLLVLPLLVEKKEQSDEK